MSKERKLLFIIRLSIILSFFKIMSDTNHEIDKLDKLLDELNNNLEELNNKVEDTLDQQKQNENFYEEQKLLMLNQQEKTNNLISEIGIDTYNKLIELQSKIVPIPTPQQLTKYSDAIEIGDLVNLINEYEPIYSDINMEHSYYGTTETRIVLEIILEKDGIIAHINNMHDYEILVSLGYQIKGYTLGNQFSLNEDGSITTELRCKKDSVKTLLK